MAVCVAEPCHELSSVDGRKLLASGSPAHALAPSMGHGWVQWESETDSSSESENSDFESPFSWDSSLDLDLRSWRNTEEAAIRKLEESSREGDEELSEPPWEDDSEDYQKAERPCEDDSLLQFSEVTQMMEPLRISSTESSQTEWDYCGSEKQDDGEDVRCQEKTRGTAVSGAQESQLHILAEDEKESFLGRENKTQETSGDQVLGEPHPQEMDQDQDDSESTSAASMLDSTSPANAQVQLSWDKPMEHLVFKRTLLSIWKAIASHRCSGPFLKAVSEKQAPGYRDVVKRPMDLTSIKKRLSTGHIRSMVQFQRDLMLMFQNAVMYNSLDHHVHHMAVVMRREVLEQLQAFAEALLGSRDTQGG